MGAGRSPIALHLIAASTAAFVLAIALWACGNNTSASAPSASSTPSSIAVSGASPGVGASSQFTAIANFSNGTTQNVTSAANWQSSNAAVATVSSGGVVTAVAPGELDLRALYKSVTGAMHIVVASSTFTLLGVVTESGSRGPIAGASVGVLDGVNAGRSTSTDGNGYYNLGGLRASSFSLEARKAGYTVADNPIGLAGDLRFDFSMTLTLPAPPPPAAATQCNAALWSHVYDPSRLQVRDACRTVTGTITDQHTNEDGDIDVRLAVDPPYTSLLNAGNISNLSGHLQTEAICQTQITDPNAAKACQGFRGTIVIPRDGTHVQITGPYVYDQVHGWMEIHPISVLTPIP